MDALQALLLMSLYVCTVAADDTPTSSVLHSLRGIPWLRSEVVNQLIDLLPSSFTSLNMFGHGHLVLFGVFSLTTLITALGFVYLLIRLCINTFGATQSTELYPKYKGATDPLTGLPHGHGRLELAEDRTYEGAFVQGKPHGRGVLTFRSEHDILGLSLLDDAITRDENNVGSETLAKARKHQPYTPGNDSGTSLTTRRRRAKSGVTSTGGKEGSTLSLSLPRHQPNSALLNLPMDIQRILKDASKPGLLVTCIGNFSNGLREGPSTMVVHSVGVRVEGVFSGNVLNGNASIYITRPKKPNTENEEKQGKNTNSHQGRKREDISEVGRMGSNNSDEEEVETETEIIPDSEWLGFRSKWSKGKLLPTAHLSDIRSSSYEALERWSKQVPLPSSTNDTSVSSTPVYTSPVLIMNDSDDNSDSSETKPLNSPRGLQALNSIQLAALQTLTSTTGRESVNVEDLVNANIVHEEVHMGDPLITPAPMAITPCRQSHEDSVAASTIATAPICHDTPHPYHDDTWVDTQDDEGIHIKIHPKPLPDSYDNEGPDNPEEDGYRRSSTSSRKSQVSYHPQSPTVSSATEGSHFNQRPRRSAVKVTSTTTRSNRLELQRIPSAPPSTLPPSTKPRSSTPSSHPKLTINPSTAKRDDTEQVNYPSSTNISCEKMVKPSSADVSSDRASTYITTAPTLTPPFSLSKQANNNRDTHNTDQHGVRSLPISAPTLPIHIPLAPHFPSATDVDDCIIKGDVYTRHSKDSLVVVEQAQTRPHLTVTSSEPSDEQSFSHVTTSLTKDHHHGDRANDWDENGIDDGHGANQLSNQGKGSEPDALPNQHVDVQGEMSVNQGDNVCAISHEPTLLPPSSPQSTAPPANPSQLGTEVQQVPEPKRTIASFSWADAADDDDDEDNGAVVYEYVPLTPTNGQQNLQETIDPCESGPHPTKARGEGLHGNEGTVTTSSVQSSVLPVHDHRHTSGHDAFTQRQSQGKSGLPSRSLTDSGVPGNIVTHQQQSLAPITSTSGHATTIKGDSVDHLAPTVRALFSPPSKRREVEPTKHEDSSNGGVDCLDKGTPSLTSPPTLSLSSSSTAATAMTPPPSSTEGTDGVIHTRNAMPEPPLPRSAYNSVPPLPSSSTPQRLPSLSPVNTSQNPSLPPPTVNTDQHQSSTTLLPTVDAFPTPLLPGPPDLHFPFTRSPHHPLQHPPHPLLMNNHSATSTYPHHLYFSRTNSPTPSQTSLPGSFGSVHSADPFPPYTSNRLPVPLPSTAPSSQSSTPIHGATLSPFVGPPTFPLSTPTRTSVIAPTSAALAAAGLLGKPKESPTPSIVTQSSSVSSHLTSHPSPLSVVGSVHQAGYETLHPSSSTTGPMILHTGLPQPLIGNPSPNPSQRTVSRYSSLTNLPPIPATRSTRMILSHNKRKQDMISQLQHRLPPNPISQTTTLINSSTSSSSSYSTTPTNLPAFVSSRPLLPNLPLQPTAAATAAAVSIAPKGNMPTLTSTGDISVVSLSSSMAKTLFGDVPTSTDRPSPKSTPSPWQQIGDDVHGITSTFSHTRAVLTRLPHERNRVAFLSTHQLAEMSTPNDELPSLPPHRSTNEHAYRQAPKSTTPSPDTPSSSVTPSSSLGPASTRLHRDVLSFSIATESVSEILAPFREAAAQYVRDEVRFLWGSHTHLICHGSLLVGTSLPSSDVDIMVAGVSRGNVLGTSSTSTPSPQRASAGLTSPWEVQRAAVERLATHLHSACVTRPSDPSSSSSVPTASSTASNANGNKGIRWVSNVRALPQAQLPLVKVTCLIDGVTINVDVSFAVSMDITHHSIPHPALNMSAFLKSLPLVAQSALLSAQLIKHYLSQISVLRPLVMVIKQLLHECQLNSPYSGGMSSHCVQIICLAYMLSPERSRIQGPRLAKLIHLLDTQDPLSPRTLLGTTAHPTTSVTSTVSDISPSSTPRATSLQPFLSSSSSSSSSSSTSSSFTSSSISAAPSTSSIASSDPPFPPTTTLRPRPLPVLTNHSLTHTLLGFLDFFGHHFNPKETGIALQSPTCFFRLKAAVSDHPAHLTSTTQSSPSPPHDNMPTLSTPSSTSYAQRALVVIDPFDANHVISHSIFRFPAIQALFRHALASLLYHLPLHAPVSASLSSATVATSASSPSDSSSSTSTSSASVSLSSSHSQPMKNANIPNLDGLSYILDNATKFGSFAGG